MCDNFDGKGIVIIQGKPTKKLLFFRRKNSTFPPLPPVYMKRFPGSIITFFLSATLIVSCQPHFSPKTVQYAGYSIEQGAKDSAIISFLQPYSAKVGETMNDVLAELGSTLQKSQPDGSLGNFLADSYLAMVRKKFDPSADMAFINNGGIRLNSLQAGPLRR
jgi:hypothetical protein